MKKRLSLILIMILFSISPLLAVFCHICGKGLPEAANFCPACGKEVASAFQPAPPSPSEEKIANPQTPILTPAPNPTVARFIPAETYLNDYESINQIELLLTNTNYAMASQHAKELRRTHAERMKTVEANYRSFSPYRRKIHDLHIKKLKTIDSYLEAWKGTEYGTDKARSLAEKDKALFQLSQINEAIETLITGGNDLVSIAKVQEMETRMDRTSTNFVVTSSYLLVDNQRINRGEPFWVIDVVSASAKVLHMGHGRSSQPICGWISVYDLERRSNWRSHPAFFYSAPTTAPTVVYETCPTPPVTVIYRYKKRYPYRHRNDRSRHKRHKYVVTDPHFW